MSGYAVIDFETTGLFPQKHDRVVEIGVVLVDEQGEFEREWSSLINPERDVGPTHIHGIRARDVLGAPTFLDVAGDVLASVRGRTIVAHNAVFDLRFLDYELTRAGWPEPRPLSAVCTMDWSRGLLRSSSRKLVDCCDAAGIALADAHEALNDARAVALLLRYYLAATHPEIRWVNELETAMRRQWPEHDLCDPSGLCVRGTVAPHRPAAWLDRIVARMPRRPQLVEAYLDVLEMALLDRYLSAHEEESLVDLACDLGFSRVELDDIHRSYIIDMAGVALADGVVTDEERAELEKVAELLGFGPGDVQQVLASAVPGPPTRHGVSLERGDCICLTGTMAQPREVYEDLAASRGLTVGGLTRRTKLLIAADPDSLSGKAKKARDYGVPIVNEQALLSYLRTM